MVGQKAFAEILDELTSLLLLPETPLEAIEGARDALNCIKKCLVFVPQLACTSVADDFAPLLQSSDLFVEFVAAVRARNWPKVSVLVHSFRSCAA
jgi:hypothetical protein